MSRLATRETVRLRLRQAFDVWFAAHADHPFRAGIAGRLAYLRAPKRWARPYAVLSIPVAMEQSTLTERIYAVTVQIMVFADASYEAEVLTSHALDLFEGQRIPGERLKDFELAQGGDVPTLPDEDEVWGAGVQLSGFVETA